MTTEQRGATEDRIVDLEVWTDVACPWCYIGATRLAKALEAFDRSDRVRVRWRAFELNPNAETGAGRREADALGESKGLTEGQVRHKFGQVSG
ncbi:MAG: DsbA family protein, partial [Tomitella sp.]|nr:DsbA family protein [Tomitella sp.]